MTKCTFVWLNPIIEMQTLKEELFAKLLTLYEETTGHEIQLIKHYKAGQTVYRFGEIPKGIYYIKSGAVKVSKHGVNDREIILRIAPPHDFVGYLSLLKGWSYQTTATCLEDSEVYFIAKPIFLKSLNSDSEFGYQVISMLCDRANDSDRTIEGLATRSVKERLAMTLLTLERTIVSHNSTPGIIKFKRKDIASMIGTIPETLSRQLADLEKTGIIKNYDKHIELINREELTKISKLGD